MRTTSARLRTLGSAAAAALIMSFGALAPAHGSLVGDDVTVQLLSPLDFINVSDTAQVTAAVVEIQPGPGTNIGSVFLLENESIDFGTTSITVRVQQGVAGDLVTGYADGARYIFSDLDITGETITAISVSVDQVGGKSTITNLAALGPGWITLLDSRTVQMFIDDIAFLDQGGGESLNVAEVTITLTSVTAVPEPSTWLLLGAGLAGLALMRRRSRASAPA